MRRERDRLCLFESRITPSAVSPGELAKIEVEFAQQLYEDLAGFYANGKTCGDTIVDAFLDIGFSHVNFRHVARYMLRKFGAGAATTSTPALITAQPSVN